MKVFDGVYVEELSPEDRQKLPPTFVALMDRGLEYVLKKKKYERNELDLSGLITAEDEYNFAKDQHVQYILEQIASAPNFSCIKCGKKFGNWKQNDDGTCYICGGDPYSRLTEKERINMDNLNGTGRIHQSNLDARIFGDPHTGDRFVHPEDRSPRFSEHLKQLHFFDEGSVEEPFLNPLTELTSVIKEMLFENAKFKVEVKLLRQSVEDMKKTIVAEVRQAGVVASDTLSESTGAEQTG